MPRAPPESSVETRSSPGRSQTLSEIQEGRGDFAPTKWLAQNANPTISGLCFARCAAAPTLWRSRIRHFDEFAIQAVNGPPKNTACPLTGLQRPFFVHYVCPWSISDQLQTTFRFRFWIKKIGDFALRSCQEGSRRCSDTKNVQISVLERALSGGGLSKGSLNHCSESQRESVRFAEEHDRMARIPSFSLWDEHFPRFNGEKRTSF